MPSGKIRAGNVAHFAGLHERVERLKRFFNRRGEIETVQVIDIDVIGPKSAQARLAGLNQVIPRRSDIVWAISHAEARLGGDEYRAATAGYGFAENLF